MAALRFVFRPERSILLAQANGLGCWVARKPSTLKGSFVNNDGPGRTALSGPGFIIVSARNPGRWPGLTETTFQVEKHSRRQYTVVPDCGRAARSEERRVGKEG